LPFLFKLALEYTIRTAEEYQRRLKLYGVQQFVCADLNYWVEK